MSTEGVTITTPTIIAVVTTLAGAVIFMFKLFASGKEKQLADKDKQIAELESTKKSWEEIAMEGIKSAKETADFYREKYESKPPILLAAPVISESHSPSTRAQRETARVATARASLANIKLVMGQTPRTEPEHKKE